MCMLERQLRHRCQCCHGPFAVPSVHRVGPRCKRSAGRAAVGCGTRLLAIHHVRGDGQDRLSRRCVAVGLVLTQVTHELFGDVHRNLVGTVVVIAERHIIALPLKVHRDAPLVADHLHPCVANRRQRVRHNGESRNARRPDPLHVAIMQCHLERLVGIFVVHVVNDLQRIHVHLGQPAHHLLKPLHHLAVLKVFRRNRVELRRHLHPRLLVAAPVDCVEEALGQVRPCTKELHLLADLHGRHAAGNAVVVPVIRPHQVVVLVLYGRGIHRHPGTKLLPVLRALLRPEHREVWLRCGPQVVERLQVAE